MDFIKAKDTYKKNAIIQKQMAKNLISLLIKKEGNTYDRTFEIGVGTGFLTDEIKKNIKYKKLFLNDINDNYTAYRDEFIKGDILRIDIPHNLDLILSNAVFQWIKDYNLLFSKLNKAIKKGGFVGFSYFGSKNFYQIKEITNIGLDYPDLNKYIENNGFEILYFEEELKTMCFKDIYEILSHIKLTGVKTENKVWTKSYLFNFREKYEQKYQSNLGLELTYHPVYYILKKS